MKLDIILERGCGLSGTVTDPSGAGVAGVVVSVMEQETGDLLWGVSDSSGGYQVQGLPSDQPVELKATSKNLGDAHVVVRCHSGGGVEWSPVLGAPKELLVELVRGEGVPLPGLRVFLMRGGAIEAGEANENGLVTFDVLEGRSYRIEVRDARNALLASRTIHVEGHESARIVVERGEATIAGSVRTSEGLAAMGATVIVVRPDRQPTSQSVVVGEDGRFQVSGLHAGEHELVIVQPGFAIRRLVGLQVEPAGLLDVGLVELSVARNIEVDLSASIGSDLVVQAVSEDGRILRRWEGICESEVSSFTLTRVPNEDTFVRVHRGDGEQVPVDEVFVPAGDGHVRVRLNAK